MKTFLTYLDEYANYDSLGTYATGGASTGPGMGQYVPIAELNAQSEKEIKNKKIKKMEKSNLIGEILAKRAKEKNITNVYFDRGGYKFHGRIKLFAETLRKNGLKF